MKADRFERVQTLFEGALKREGAERDAYLVAECGDDSALLEELRTLLAADADSNTFVDKRPVDPPVDPLASSATDAVLPPGTEIGGYVIEEELGHGGFGRVYRAVHPVIGKTAAIKVLYARYSSSPEHAKRFVNEARAVNEIGHPDIIDVFAFGETPEGCLYFVMELSEGPTLEQLLRERGPLPLHDVLPLLRRLAAAVDAAHERGIIHRDLKPSNVLVGTDIDGTLHPTLVDFGIAKLRRTPEGEENLALDSLSISSEQILGTPAYMAPEQARGQKVDARTDVYAFGVLVYRTLTGRLPFEGDNPLDILMGHVHETPPPPSGHIRGLPRGVDRVLSNMLAKAPHDRPASLGAGVEALAKAVHDEISRASNPRRLSIPLVGAAVVLAGGLWLMTRPEVASPEPNPTPTPAHSTPSSAAESPDEEQVVTPAQEPEPPPEPPTVVRLEITDPPEGTSVLDEEGTPLGEVPGFLILPRSDRSRTLVFRCDGYEDARHTIIPNADRRLQIVLEPLRRKPRRKLNPDLESPFPR